MENVVFTNKIVFETNHHCNVGVTGVLCMPTYVLVNPVFRSVSEGKWVIWGANNGAMFTMSPNAVDQANIAGNFFPSGYNSLANPYWTYLLALDGGKSCFQSSDAEKADGVTAGLYSTRYSSGILCKRPLRRLEIWTFGKSKATWGGVSLTLQLWQKNVQISSVILNYFQIGDDASNTKKQGYSATVIPGTDHEYRLSLTGGGGIPTDWIIEFSDPVFGNRWIKDEIILKVTGRICPGVVNSQHDRRYIWGGNEYLQVSGRGACTTFPGNET
jgi:hypothetical protein